MKNLMNLTKILAVLSVIFFAAACNPDDGFGDGGTNVINPLVVLDNETGFISEATTIDPGTTINVRLSASMGDNEMHTLTVKQDGDLLETTRYTVDGLEINNPAILFDADRTSFTYDISIDPHDAGTSTYSFEVGTETSGDFDVTSVDVSITEGQLSLVINGPTSISLDNESLVSIGLTASQGGSPLSTLAVLEGGVMITDLSRLRYGDVGTQFDSNPFTLPADDMAGFVKDIIVRSHASAGTIDYTISLADESGATADDTYTMTINTPATTLSNEFFSVPLFNNSGSGFGTIDLETGQNVSSVSSTAGDLLDSGNDGNGVWNRTIEPVDGSTLLHTVDPSYTYDGIASRESLINAYDSGFEISQSGTISVGTTLAARIGDDYYILVCVAVDDTGAANSQNYTFNIKQSLG